MAVDDGQGNEGAQTEKMVQGVPNNDNYPQMLTSDHVNFINHSFIVEPFENMSDNDFSTNDEDDNLEDKKRKKEQKIPPK